jgi:hypothetical protein
MGDEIGPPGDGSPLFAKWTRDPNADGFLNIPEDAALMRLGMAGFRRCRWCLSPMVWRKAGYVCSNIELPCDG